MSPESAESRDDACGPPRVSGDEPPIEQLQEVQGQSGLRERG